MTMWIDADKFEIVSEEQEGGSLVKPDGDGWFLAGTDVAAYSNGDSPFSQIWCTWARERQPEKGQS